MPTNETLIEELVHQMNQQQLFRHSFRVPHGSRGRFRAIMSLYYGGEQIQPSELGQIMNVSTPRITAILNKLEEEDLIIRKIATEDRRKIFVSLSKKGKEVVARKLKQQREYVEQLAERVEQSDLEAYIRVLKAMEELNVEEVE